MRIWAYLKASKDRQDIREQKQVILEFAEKEKISVSRFIEFPISSATTKDKKIDILLRQLQPKDTLIVSDLSRIGWSVREIIKTVDTLVKREIRFIAVREGIHLDEQKEEVQSQIIIRVFGLLADIEHQLVSQRTREALAIAKAKGRKGGRPPALNTQQQQLALKLYKEGKHSVEKICQMMGISKPTLYSYIRKAKSNLRSSSEHRNSKG